MKELSLAILILESNRFTSILAYDSIFEQLIGAPAESLLGRLLEEVFPGIQIGTDTESAYIGGHWVQYSIRELSRGRQMLIVVLQSTVKRDIYQVALDLMDIGVQIYSYDSSLIFINTASEEMSGVSRSNVLGKPLTSIYDTDEQQSSVLAALATHASVYNKLDNFKVRSGNLVSVLNTSIPYFDEQGKIEAVVNLEFTTASINKLASTAQIMQKIIPTTPPSPSGQPARRPYYRFEDIVGNSEAIQEAISLAKMAAAQGSSVFIVGETGTGKELVAQSIYSMSPRYHSFVSVNCGTISEGLADAALFGTVRGAFTGSVNAEGLFAAADGGVLFLDEINSLTLSTQARLLRVLQEGTYMKVGAVKESNCNVRVLASCNQDPWELMQAGKLRQDLFYRLAAVVIKVPPLRERLDDLELIIDHFLRHYSKKFNKQVRYIAQDALTLLRNYNWPGNVRELKNIVEFAVNATDNAQIEIRHFPGYIQNKLRCAQNDIPKPQSLISPTSKSLTKQLNHYERNLIEHSLRRNGYNITKTAEELSLSRQALQYKLKKYHFELI